MDRPYRNIGNNHQYRSTYYFQPPVWWEGPTYMKDDWKSTRISMAGEQCVMTILETKRLRWHVVWWVSVGERCCTLDFRKEPALSAWITWTVRELKQISGTASTTSGEITTVVTMKTSTLDVVSTMYDQGWRAVSYSSLSITQLKIYSSSYPIKRWLPLLNFYLNMARKQTFTIIMDSCQVKISQNEDI